MRRCFILCLVIYYACILHADELAYLDSYRDRYSQEVFNFCTPQTEDIMKFGNNEASSFTGTMTLSIPVYTIKDFDFNLPITLNYVSDGFKPRKHSEYVGYNWSLNAGGCITREVHGLPDEYKDIEYKEPITGTTIHVMGFLAFSRENPYYSRMLQSPEDTTIFHRDTLQGGTYSTFASLHPRFKSQQSVNYKDVDYLPDIFHFNFCGHNGVFTFNNQGHVTILSGDVVDIDVSDLYQDMAYMRTVGQPQHMARPSVITIRTMDGYTYQFGGDTTSVVHSHSMNSCYWDGDFIGGVPEFSQSVSPDNILTPPVSAWYLKCIIAPNGRQVVYEYEGKWQYNENYCAPPRVSWIERYDDEWQDETTTRNINYLYFSGLRSKQVILKKISIPDKNLIANFYNSVVDNNHLLYGHSNYTSRLHNHPQFPVQELRLDSITVNCGSNVLQRAALTYSYKSDNTDKNHWTFLDEVSLLGIGKYDFSYFRGEYPTLSAISNRDNPRGYVSCASFSTSLGMLQRVTYPTGGYTQYAYDSCHACNDVYYCSYDNATLTIVHNPDWQYYLNIEDPSYSPFNYNLHHISSVVQVAGAPLLSACSYNTDGTLKRKVEYAYSNGVFFDPFIHMLDDLLTQSTGNRYSSCPADIRYQNVSETISLFANGSLASKEKNVYQYDCGIPSISLISDATVYEVLVHPNVFRDWMYYNVTGNPPLLPIFGRWANGGLGAYDYVAFNASEFASGWYNGEVCNIWNTVSAFKSHAVSLNSLTFSDAVLSSSAGQLRQKTNYKLEAGEEILCQRITYTYDNDYIRDTITAIDRSFYWHVMRPFKVKPYRLQQTTTENIIDSITTIVTYSYDDRNRITKTCSSASENKLLFTYFRYPDSVLCATPSTNIAKGVKTLVLKNMIGEPLEVYSGIRSNNNEYITSGQLSIPSIAAITDSPMASKRLLYSLKLNNPLISSAFRPLKATSSSITFDSRYSLVGEYEFNNKYRLTKATPIGQTPTYYVWNNDELDTIQIGTHIKAYDFIPYVGVQSITDERGVTTYYVYDQAGRVKEVYQMINNEKQVLQSYDYHYTTEL